MTSFLKNGQVHKYPLPCDCQVIYNNEEVTEDIAYGVEKCHQCFKLMD